MSESPGQSPPIGAAPIVEHRRVRPRIAVRIILAAPGFFDVVPGRVERSPVPIIDLDPDAPDIGTGIRSQVIRIPAPVAEDGIGIGRDRENRGFQGGDTSIDIIQTRIGIKKHIKSTILR